MNSKENHKMWKYYASTSESIALSTDYITLYEELPDYVNIGIVRYINYQKDAIIPNSLNFLQKIMHKDLKYSFEKEVRAVISPAFVTGENKCELSKNMFQLADNSGIIFYAPKINITKIIHSIVFHPKSTSKYKSIIQEICRENSIVEPINSMYE